MNRESDDKLWMVSTFTTDVIPTFDLSHDDWPTSEDGDFVVLRKERERKQAKQRKDDLQKKVSVSFSNLRTAISLSGNLKVASQTSQTSETKSTFFNAISNGSLEKVKEMIHLYNIDLTKLMLDEESQQLALHYALEEKQVEIAEYFINIWDSHFLINTYNVNVKKITGKKNVLHRITEERYVELARLFLSRLDIKERKEVILQEIPIDILEERPQTLSCLHLAAYIGSNELIGLYLDHGVDVNSQNSKGDTALLWAARWNRTEVMETLLKLGANPNIDNHKGSTALHWAVRYQHVEAVRILTSNESISIKSKRKLGLISPIILSSALGCREIVELLLDAGADVNQEIRGNERPIHHAAKEGHENVLDLLIHRGANRHKVDNFGNTALLLAIKNDHPLAVHTLIEAGSYLCHKNRDGMNVWSYALCNKSNKCLETLVYHIKKIINEKKNNYTEGIKALLTIESPIFEAAARNATEKLIALARMGIELETTDHNLNNLHHYAASYGKHEVIRQFADRVNVNCKNRFGETPLHFACFTGCYETVKALLDFGAKANVKNKDGKTTALHTAASSQKMDSKTMKLLIDYMLKTHSWESLNEKDNTLHTAIHVAALKAKPEVIWECRFISCKDPDKEGNTPFHLAVRSSQPEILSTMLDIYDFTDRDADIDKTNKKGETPLYLVVLEGFKDQTERLIRYGADLHRRDCDGNSILHKLVEASVEDAKNMEKHFEMMDLIIDKAATSYCIRKKIDYPCKDKLKMDEYRFLAIMELLSIKNKENLSVLDLACKIAAKEALEKLLMLKGVTQIEKNNQVYFDISHVTPRTNDSLGYFCCRKDVKSYTSCIEWLISVEDTERASMLLDIPPLKVAEEVYGRTCSWVYVILMLLHIIYMGLISYNADDILKSKNGTSYSACKDDIFFISKKKPMCAILYLVTPIEPIIILLCCLLAIIRSECIRCISKGNFLREIFSLKMVRHIYMDYTPLVIMLLFSGLIITWMIFLSFGNMNLNMLSVSLCIGWLICIIFTRGFKGIHHFWRILIIMIFRDVIRFLFLYAFVLLSFSFAMHVLIDVTKHKNVTVFNTTVSTFNLMTGISDSDTFKETMGTNDIFYFFYTAYMVLSTIILINLLIAMMNDSYQAIQMQESLTWRIDSMRLGLNIEKSIPFLTKLSSRGKIIEEYCLVKGDIKRWYAIFSVEKMKKYQRRKERDERSQMILYKNK